VVEVHFDPRCAIEIDEPNPERLPGESFAAAGREDDRRGHEPAVRGQQRIEVARDHISAREKLDTVAS
jgi:hypothetical protein